MSKIKWDQIGKRKYKTGVDHGVLYLYKNGGYNNGVPWNGLTTVTKSPSGAEPTKLYADNMEYLSIRSAETLGLTVECYTYPPEFASCNGESELAKGISLGQQRRDTFGFAYRNKVGNDVENEDYGFEINLVYGCTASPSEQSNQTINDSPSANTFSYSVTTTPVNVSGLGPDGKPYKPSATLIIDSTEIDREKLVMLEEILYGKDAVYTKTADTSFDTGKDYYEMVNGEYEVTTDTSFDSSKDYYEMTSAGVEPRMPLPDEIKQLMAEG